ncbi:hypothetical protein LR48_Vigan715s000300 [Vigna angularis]|uniref:Uncharacterized protein n=1 Tax=Phaseolus angularis TaxID=3914 RepID=A0A0L9TG02_PHAAN|nr:hypothetical protein LR48_Vigan715s000300 [Vigna angularis]
MTNQQPPTIFFIATNRKTYSRRHHHEQPLRFVPPKSQPFIVAPRFATTISTKPSHCETCRKSQQHHLATIESRVIHRLPRTTSKPSSLIAMKLQLPNQLPRSKRLKLDVLPNKHLNSDDDQVLLAHPRRYRHHLNFFSKTNMMEAVPHFKKCLGDPGIEGYNSY